MEADVPPIAEQNLESGQLRRAHVTALAGFVGLVFLVVALVRTTMHLTHVLGLVMLAVALAYLTAPLRRRFGRSLGHGLAAAIVSLLTFAVIVGIGLAVTRDITHQAERLGEVLSSFVKDLGSTSMPARVAKSMRIEAGIRSSLARAGTTVVAGQPTTSGLSSSIGDLVVVIVLGAFLQGTGTAAVDRVISRWPRPRRKAIRDRWKLIDDRAGTLYRWSIVLAVGTGAVVGFACWAMGIPGGLVLGTWAGLWAPVATLGCVVGFTPLLIVALVQSDVANVVALGIALLLAAGALAARQKLGSRSELRPGAATWVLSFAVGYAAAGTAGLILATAAVAFVAAFSATQLTEGDRASAVDADAVDGLQGTGRRPPSESQAGPVPSEPLFRSSGVAWWSPLLSARGLSVVAGTTIAGSLVWMLLGHLRGFTAWFAIAVLLSVGLDRAVASIRRRVPHISRGVAASIVMVLAIVVFLGVAVLAAQARTKGSASLSTELTRAVSRYETAPVIGPTLRAHHAAEWVKTQLDDLPNTFKPTSSEKILPTIGARMADVFWTLLLAVALLLDGPRLIGDVRRRVPVRYRRQYGKVIDVARVAIGGYLAGSAVIAALDGLFVLITAVVLPRPARAGTRIVGVRHQLRAADRRAARRHAARHTCVHRRASAGRHRIGRVRDVSVLRKSRDGTFDHLQGHRRVRGRLATCRAGRRSRCGHARGAAAYPSRRRGEGDHAIVAFG